MKQMCLMSASSSYSPLVYWSCSHVTVCLHHSPPGCCCKYSMELQRGFKCSVTTAGPARIKPASLVWQISYKWELNGAELNRHIQRRGNISCCKYWNIKPVFWFYSLNCFVSTVLLLSSKSTSRPGPYTTVGVLLRSRVSPWAFAVSALQLWKPHVSQIGLRFKNIICHFSKCSFHKIVTKRIYIIAWLHVFMLCSCLDVFLAFF